jgi:hypothetical protein
MPIINVFQLNEPVQGAEPGSHHAAAIMGYMAAMLSNALDDVKPALDSSIKEKPEKTRSKNPNRLAKEQHVFPLKTMAQFAQKGRVSVRIKEPDKVLSLKVSHSIFCAHRAWDERAEKGWMKAIEDQFQKTVGPIVGRKLSSVPSNEKPIIDRMYALWYMRSRFRRLPKQEIRLNGTSGDDLNKEQEENLEKNGYMYVRKGGLVPARHLNGLHLQMRVGDFVEKLAAEVTRWGVISTQSGNFVVPDVPQHNVIPLSPDLALVGSAPDGVIVEQNLAEINRAQSSVSENYFFARDFSKCPI